MRSFLFLIIGILIGAYVMREHDDRRDSEMEVRGDSFSARAEAAAERARVSLDDKLAQWHLTSGDIRADLDKTGRVVRANAQVAGDRISDARIATVIKAKYVLDRDISAIDISVHVDGGHVVLAGRVGSPAIIGRAMGLALDTDGVVSVVSLLSVRPLE